MFLTLNDPRDAPKGSRDPLGLQLVWTRLGRRIVGNLTTVTNSVADFQLLILGCGFAGEIADQTAQSVVDVFLKWEQIAAYARLATKQGGFRGIGRASQKFHDASADVPIGAGGDAQLLANQKTYGIWGLYSVAARSSGLIDAQGGLTPAGVSVYAQLRVQLGSATLARIISLLKTADSLHKKKDEKNVLEPVGTLLNLRAPDRTVPEPLRTTLRNHLAYSIADTGEAGERASSCQRLFAEALADEKNWKLGATALMRIADAVQRKDVILGAELALHLRTIVAVEAVIARAAALFDLALGADKSTLADFAGRIVDKGPSGEAAPLGPIDLAALDTPDIASVWYVGETEGEDGRRRWPAIAAALRDTRYEQALTLLIAQNASVMRARGGGAWIEIKDGTTLDVRFGDTGDAVASSGDDADLAAHWRHAYFIDALRDVAQQLS